MRRLLLAIFGREAVRCEVCNKWTEPSMYYDRICSLECLKIKHDTKGNGGE